MMARAVLLSGALLAVIACGGHATTATGTSAAETAAQAPRTAGAPSPAAERPAPSTSAAQATATPKSAAGDSGAQTVTGNAANKAVELHVDKYEIASSFQSTAAPAGHHFVIVDAHWHNILAPQQVSDSDTHPDPTYGVGGLGSGNAAAKKGPEKTHTVYVPYVIPDVKTQLQLIVNGESGAKLVNDDFNSAGVLSAAGQRIEHDKDVVGRYVFDVAAPVTSVELAYFDKVYGNIRIPIAGTAPAADAGAIAGPISSGGFTLSVMSVAETDTVGETHAPAGTRFVVVTARGQGDASIGDNYLQIDPASASRLVESDGHLYPTVKVQGAEDVWSGAMRFVPATPQRGKLVFAVPAQHGPFALSVAVPGQPAPMRLALSSTVSSSAKLPPPLTTIQDGSTATFYLYGVRRNGALLILDVAIENKTGSGMDFQTKEQIEMLQGDTTINATDEDLAASPRSLPDDGVIPPHTLGRFDIPFRVPPDASGLTLYFRGFEKEQKIPLPAAR